MGSSLLTQTIAVASWDVVGVASSTFVERCAQRIADNPKLFESALGTYVDSDEFLDAVYDRVQRAGQTDDNAAELAVLMEDYECSPFFHLGHEKRAVPEEQARLAERIFAYEVEEACSRIREAAAVMLRLYPVDLGPNVRVYSYSMSSWGDSDPTSDALLLLGETEAVWHGYPPQQPERHPQFLEGVRTITSAACMHNIIPGGKVNADDVKKMLLGLTAYFKHTRGVSARELVESAPTMYGIRHGIQLLFEPASHTYPLHILKGLIESGEIQ